MVLVVADDDTPGTDEAAVILAVILDEPRLVHRTHRRLLQEAITGPDISQS